MKYKVQENNVTKLAAYMKELAKKGVNINIIELKNIGKDNATNNN